jgi:microcin C transport system permease protein
VNVVVAPAAPPPARRGLSPINRRRLDNFKRNRRGYWSFWAFLALFVLTLFADVIANDRPIVANYKGEWLFPVLIDYPEEKFGGFLARTDYRDATIQEEIEANGWAIWPPIRFRYDTIYRDHPGLLLRRGGEGAPACGGFPAPPTWWASDADICDPTPERVARFRSLANTNWLGTDDQGRDVLARVIYGFRISVLFGLILAGISSVIGVLAGAVQGYYGGWTDLIFQRVIEIWNAIPSLYLLIIISAVITPSFWVLLGILLLFSWVSLVGVVRAEFLRARNFEYVRAARALGLSNATIMFRHLLPNAMVATLTFLPFILNGSITTLTSLDFLGFGLPPGSPSLGELLAQGKSNLQAPWLGLTGFFVIALMLSLLIFIGEAVRDAFDPRKTFA